MTSNNWAVFRQDFTGNEFIVERNLSEERANELVVEYESHKHHQHYWAKQIPDSKIDFAELLTQLLGTGSSIDSALKVRRNQSASTTDCIAALAKVREIAENEAEKIVLQIDKRENR